LELNLKRAWYRWQIWRGRFRSEEPEFDALEHVVGPGDWALDIGANIGTYTRRLSELVGPNGRVIAFEPMARTFELLVANTADRENVSLCNLAVSDVWHTVSMNVPRFGSGLLSYANATIAAESGVSVLAVALDNFAWPNRIALIKLDAEGHEPEVLRGLRRLLERDRPTLIVEFNTPLTAVFLEQMGYAQHQLPNGAHVSQAR
jgi:FkbM family methyltransferase